MKMDRITPRPGVRSTWGAMAHLYDTVISLITQPAEKRSDAEIEQILPWFRKKSDMFKHLHAEVLKDIIKNCEFTSCQRDSVIIRQGEKGDWLVESYFGKSPVLLLDRARRETVSIHINTASLTDEEFVNIRKRQLDEEALVLREGPDLHPLDRSKYGNYLGKIEAGKSFGELALISNDCVRNASIISTEVTDLLIVRKDLYNRSLRFHQAQAFEEKQKFVNSLPLFHSWQSRYKNMMAMSLKKEILKFEDVVVKQGAPVDGLIFIVSGQVKVVMDPSQHKTQYPHHFPKGAIADLEKEKARDLLRKEMNLEKKRGFDHKETYQKRSAVVHETKKQANKHLELCLMGAVDIIGDLEMALGLQTYAETIICTEEARLFVLDQNNYDRLLEKRHPQSLNIMKDIVHNKLTLHFSRLSEQTLPLFRYFLYTLDEKEKKEKLRKAPVVQQERPPQIELSPDGIQKGPLINMYGPGSVFYLIRMRENKRRHRKIERSKYADKLDFNKVQENQKTSGRPPQIVEEEIPEEGVSPDHESQLAISLARNAMMTDDMTDSFLAGVGEMYSQAEVEADYACSDSALSLLERRIQDWHNGFNEGAKGNKRTVKLHRYQAEDSKPRPGNKIVIRLKNKSSVAFTSFRKDEFDAQTEPANIKHSARLEFNLPNIHPSSDDETNNQQEIFVESNRLRPKTCPVGARQRFRRRNDSKQYTHEEYLDLKAELKRRQMAYKSFLPLQRSTTSL